MSNYRGWVSCLKTLQHAAQPEFYFLGYSWEIKEKVLQSFGTTSYGQMTSTIPCSNMRRQEFGEGKVQLMIYNLVCEACWSVTAWTRTWLPMELVPFNYHMIWLLTKAVEQIMKCSGWNFHRRFSQKLQNPLDDASLCRWRSSLMFCNVQVNQPINWSESKWAAFHSLRTKCPTNKQELNSAAVDTPGRKSNLWWGMWVKRAGPLLQKSLVHCTNSIN